jgi:hypothetical protein
MNPDRFKIERVTEAGVFPRAELVGAAMCSASHEGLSVNGLGC